MSQGPSISIIIPIYNAETLIENCVNSILSQAYTDYEIILVDDGSIDKSLQVCQNIANKHHNIIVLHKKNGGQTSARKLGFEYSTGEYIYFVDADDYIPQNSLSFLYNKAIKEDLDIIEGATISSFLGVNKKEFFSYEGIFTKKEHLKMMYKRNCHQDLHAVLYKRTLFTKETFNIPYDVRVGEDFYLNLSLSLMADRIGVYNEIVYHYIENKQSITHIYKFNSIRPQEYLIECSRRELLRHNLFYFVKEDFYKGAILCILTACLHNLSLRNDKYIKIIAMEAISHLKDKYYKFLCFSLLHPIFIPFLVILNKVRKFILSKMRPVSCF